MRTLSSLVFIGFFVVLLSISTPKVFAQNLEEAPIYCLSSNYVFCEESFKIFNLRIKNENEKKNNSLISLEDALLQKGEDKQATNRIINKVIPKIFLEQIDSSASSSLNKDLIFQLINDHRVKIGLSPFEKEKNLCELARLRAVEIPDEIFVTGRLHSGIYNRTLAYWVTENLIYQRTEEQAVNWWLNSPVHRSAIEGNYKFSCSECNEFTCTQLFTNFTPK